MSNGLPSYIASAVPNPMEKRAPWYKNTAPTYAGIFLWFVFWDQASGSGLSGGLNPALLGVVIAGVICHSLFYMVPALLGYKSGLPLYVVGSSTFGATGGLLMPGFFMGILQFGWLGVNIFFSAKALSGEAGTESSLFMPLCVVWGVAAALVGLMGIQYVAKVATFLPIIPLAVLVTGLVFFGGSATSYTAPTPPPPAPAMDPIVAILSMVGYIVGFFATAGAAGVDFGTNARNKMDVRMGGIVGILIAIVLTAGISVVAVAGARAMGVIDGSTINMTAALQKKLDPKVYSAVMIGLTIASFPGACFSSFIAANSFKTVMPRIPPFLSVGIGAAVSIVLGVTKVAGDLGSVFGLIGASFGPICGAMMVDYILAGMKWSGPRAGFNPAGWIAWAVGFVVGILPNPMLAKIGVQYQYPYWQAAPVIAFAVGAVLYFVCSMAGLRSKVIPYAPAGTQEPAAVA
jgi:purine-cytosine permease-like protein